MRTIKILFLIFILSITASKAQDVIFSQFQTTNYHDNPAFSGIGSSFRIALNYRELYANTSSNINNYAFSTDVNIPSLNIGIGANISHFTEGNGILNTTVAGISFAKHIKIRRNMFISFGIDAGIINKTNIVKDLVFSDQLDPSLGIINPSSARINNINILKPNFSAGAIFIYKLKKITHYFSISSNHLNMPKMNSINSLDNRYPILFMVRYLGKIKTDDNSKTVITPSFKFITQNIYYEYIFGSGFSYNYLETGLYFRSKNLSYKQNLSFLIINIGATFKQKMKFIYSFEYILSPIYNSHVHEIGLVYQFPKRKKASCPSY